MKKSLLTVLFAVSAVMAFAAPAELARIDVYNLGRISNRDTPLNSFKITDKGTAVIAESPNWEMEIHDPKAKREGEGVHTAFKFNGTDWQTGTVTLTAVGNGKLEIRLMGPFVRDPQTKKPLRMQVDFKKVVVNGRTVYEGKNGGFVRVWHNKPYRIEKDIRVKDGDTVKIEATFRPSAKE